MFTQTTKLPDVLDFEPKPITRLLSGLRRYWHSPQFFGLEHINPKQPTLFVGNHTIYGMLDGPFIVEEIYTRTGVFIRALADRMHFKLPHGKWLLEQGVVVGSRENCSKLMQDGQSILVYPGGGREVAKRRGEAYKLIWKKRTGFARMAIQHGYSITPVASVGPEESYTIRIDANNILKSPLGTWLDKTGLLEKHFRNGDMIFPVATGWGPTVLPRPERFYFGFGKPISTKSLQGLESDDATLWKMRQRVEKDICREIDLLQSIRKEDPSRHLIPKFF